MFAVVAVWLEGSICFDAGSVHGGLNVGRSYDGGGMASQHSVAVNKSPLFALVLLACAQKFRYSADVVWAETSCDCVPLIAFCLCEAPHGCLCFFERRKHIVTWEFLQNCAKVSTSCVDDSQVVVALPGLSRIPGMSRCLSKLICHQRLNEEASQSSGSLWKYWKAICTSAVQPCR